MKKIFTLLIGIVFSLTILNAQDAPPQAFSYKATIKKANGAIVASKTISLRISILQGSSSGTTVYSEVFHPTTNEYGQIDIEIGHGETISGDFSTIPWSLAEYFLMTEIDVKGGSDYAVMSVVQLLSVPYALYAGSVDYNNILDRPSLFDGTWLSLTGKPTTVAGLGITDAVTITGDQTIAGNKTFTGTTSVSNALNAANGFGSIYSETEKRPILGQRGNVSIGTASNWDWSELDVNGGINVLPGQWDWGSGIALSAWDAQGGGGEQYLIGSTGALAHEGAGKFFIRNTNHYWDAIFIMDNQGRVGIDMGFDGLPQYTLDVSGDINFTGELLKNGSPFNTGFLTTETDPIFTSHAANGITATNITNWNTAFNWGNHSGLYRPISYVPAWSEINGKPTFATVATSGSYNDLNNKPTIDGSETKATGGTNVTITGVGTEASPYVINSTGGNGSSSHSIGETYGGGIVFYVYDNGQHGLIAATTDQSASIRWYAGTYSYTMALADGVGAGKANTAIIIANQECGDGATYAARICNEYSVTVGGVTYGDWYLPSKFELNLLYLQKSVVGGFANYGYWSSSEVNYSLNAWAQNFTNGDQGGGNKYTTFYVRAVRAF